MENTSEIRYVVNPSTSEQVIAGPNQQIIVAGDQFMVVDNVIEQQGITFQDQQFDMQNQPQQVFYMDTDDNQQDLITTQTPIVLNQITGVNNTNSQKVIMLQTPSQSVVLQPQLVTMQPKPTRFLINHANQQPSLPRATLLTNRINMVNNKSPVIRHVTTQRSPQIPSVNRQTMPVKSVVSRPVRAPVPRPPLRQQIPKPVQRAPGIKNNTQGVLKNEGVQAVSLEDGRVVSLAEYHRMVAEKKASADLNKAMPKERLVTSRPPIRANFNQGTFKENTNMIQRGPAAQGRIIYTNPSKLPYIIRNFSLPKEIKDIACNTVDYQNSIRMFVLLANGEQRLITFTVPKEDCHINEILEQVGVDITSDTSVAVKELTNEGIDIVVAVDFGDEDENPSESDNSSIVSSKDGGWVVEEEEPIYVEGKVAVCTNCGVLSDDFNKCVRCRVKFPPEVKAVDDPTKCIKAAVTKKPTIAINLKNNGVNKSPKRAKPKGNEQPIVVTLSSDDEDENKKENNIYDQLKKNCLAVSKEPSINEIKTKSSKVNQIKPLPNTTKVNLTCRTARIGSYKFTPPEAITLSNTEVVIKAPHQREPLLTKTIRIDRNSIVKVLINFQKVLPSLFIYVVESMGEKIREALDMREGEENYFNPTGPEESHRRITILPDMFTEENSLALRVMYGGPINLLIELNAKEANNILIRTCPKEVKNAQSLQNSTDIQNLFIYPPGKGGLQISTEDYACLAKNQFLNDIIIDFYLTYIVNSLPKEVQENVHLFSTFFYKRLTSNHSKAARQILETEPLKHEELRHARVRKWTKNINIFNKKFIIIPINENSHWFLAIICFPGMEGPHNLQGKPVKIEPATKKKSNSKVIGAATITPIKVEKKVVIHEDESDKDEAEGDESEFESAEEAEEVVTSTNDPKVRQPIQQPCILVFDSLAGSSRARVVATLRDYLMCEYHVKTGIKKKFDKSVIRGACPKVPQQTNYTDCGLYLLQYVESFFKTPITDYHIPISHLKQWFPEIDATKKREDIANLIKKLMVQFNKDVNVLPDICLPTHNGELVDYDEDEEEEHLEEEAEESSQTNQEANEDQSTSDDKNTTMELDDSMINDNVSSPKPTTQNDVLSYLKAKRIIKHMRMDVDDSVSKKFKNSDG